MAKGPAGYAQAAIMAAAGIAQTANVIAATVKGTQEINGAQVKRTGGDIFGASHSNGGVMVNAEGGEFMVNKETMANPSYANAIRNMNSSGLSGGGGAMLSEERVAQIAAQTVGAIPVNVVETDITDSQRKVKVREKAFSVK
jgi:hypothetical protein